MLKAVLHNSCLLRHLWNALSSVKQTVWFLNSLVVCRKPVLLLNCTWKTVFENMLKRSCFSLHPSFVDHISTSWTPGWHMGEKQLCQGVWMDDSLALKTSGSWGFSPDVGIPITICLVQLLAATRCCPDGFLSHLLLLNQRKIIDLERT